MTMWFRRTFPALPLLVPEISAGRAVLTPHEYTKPSYRGATAPGLQSHPLGHCIFHLQSKHWFRPDHRADTCPCKEFGSKRHCGPISIRGPH
jgi:hypothetical protein